MTWDSGVSGIPSPLRDPLPTITSFRTRSARSSATFCAIIDPIEKPRTSTLVSPSASINTPALFAISANVTGTSPLELAMPALLKSMTSRDCAKSSVKDGPNCPCCQGCEGMVASPSASKRASRTIDGGRAKSRSLNAERTSKFRTCRVTSLLESPEDTRCLKGTQCSPGLMASPSGWKPASPAIRECV